MRQMIANFPYGSNRGSITPQPPDYVDARVLSANTAKRHDLQTAITAGAKFVSFSADGDFYAKFGDSSVTAAVPSGDVTDGSAAELNPMARKIPASATHVSLVAPAATKITLSFWS